MRSARKIAILLALLLCGGSAFGLSAPEGGHPSRAKVDAILGREVFKTGQAGVLAVTMEGDTLACSHAAGKMVPASNVKLVTTGLALVELGPEYRFRTTLAYSGNISAGVLEGDLYIVGGGDPTLGASCECASPIQSVFRDWTRLVREAGIRSIEGRIIGDPRLFRGTPECLGWTYDDLGTDYGAGPSGLNFYENAQLLEIYPASNPGDAPEIIAKYPYTPWMYYSAAAETAPRGASRDLYVINTDFGPYARVCGRIPAGKMASLMTSNRFPAYTCAYYFRVWLQEQGIPSSGWGDVAPGGYVRTDLLFSDAGSAAADSAELTVIGGTESANLAMIASTTNHESDNFYAEALMHAVALRRRGSSEYADCRLAVEDALASLGLETAGRCRIFDGSGLSRKNYVSPSFLVDFLCAMARTGVSERFIKSLPQPGEGTLSERLRGKPEDVRSRVYMKSGSMNGIRCFSGYVLSSEGNPSHDIAFSILTGNITAPSSALLPSIDEIIAALAAEN